MVNSVWLIAGCLVFIVATASRLARYNVAEPPLGHLMFYGIPTTFMGAIIASGFLSWKTLHLVDESMAIAPFFLFIAAIAMVSSVKLPQVKPRKNLALNIFQAMNVLFAYIFAPMQMFPEVLFCQGLFYVLVGIVWYGIAPPVDDAELQENPIANLG